jgi:hypothetical protein
VPEGGKLLGAMMRECNPPLERHLSGLHDRYNRDPGPGTILGAYGALRLVVPNAIVGAAEATLDCIAES